jgi:hypothetical protein
MRDEAGCRELYELRAVLELSPWEDWPFLPGPYRSLERGPTQRNTAAVS